MSKKSVFITGGSRGIGKCIAIGLAKEGYDVKIAGRSPGPLEETLSELKAINKNSEAFKLDVSNLDDVKNAFSKLDDLYALVCCAGIYGPIGPLEKIDLNEWKKTFEINVMGTVYCVSEASKILKRKKSGRIVLFGGGGQGPMPGFSAYVSSKGAINRFCETLGKELQEDGIYLNSIAPGFVMTELQKNVLKAGPEHAGSDFFNKVKEADESGGGVSPDLSLKLVSELLDQKSEGLWGKLISAQWDDLSQYDDLRKLSESDLLTNKRVVSEDGNTRFK